MLSFIFSFPFIVIKFEEASYLSKVYYPFWLSMAASRYLNRRVMLHIQQSLMEEVAILTVLLGYVTELCLS